MRTCRTRRGNWDGAVFWRCEAESSTSTEPVLADLDCSSFLRLFAATMSFLSGKILGISKKLQDISCIHIAKESAKRALREWGSACNYERFLAQSKGYPMCYCTGSIWLASSSVLIRRCLNSRTRQFYLLRMRWISVAHVRRNNSGRDGTQSKTVDPSLIAGWERKPRCIFVLRPMWPIYDFRGKYHHYHPTAQHHLP